MFRLGRSILLVVAIVSLISGCGRNELPPNIVLITLDTVRSDHLGCYGYSRPTSPSIDGLSERSTLYTRAYASAPWTVPSHASLFTGKFPFEHGAHTFAVKERVDNNVNPLSPRFLTVAEALVAEGYETAAFVANVAYLQTHWQLDQGFQTYDVKRVRGDVLNRKVFGWLDGRGSGPFFLFVNYMDAHGPYNTSRPAPFLDPPAIVDGGKLMDELDELVMPGTSPAPPDLVKKVIDQYDTGIFNLDSYLGALLAHLVELDLYENTMIVITSDHGEYFGEHNLMRHSKDIYEPVMQVPLIVKNPGQRSGRRVDDRVTLSDIPGLMFSRFPGELSAQLSERFPDLPGNHPVIAENYYTRPRDLFHPVWGHRFNRIRTSIYDGPYKLIVSSDEQHELYNLETDPDESRNLFDHADHADVARRLEATLHNFQSSRERADSVQQRPLSEEQLERLRSLGYIK